MVIEFKSDIFDEPSNLKDLNYLISIFSNNRRYGYFIDLSIVKDSELYQSLLDIDKVIIEEYFNKYISEPTKFDYLIEKNSTSTSFNFDESKRFFNQPLTIILENSLNDGFFLEALISNFKRKSKKIKNNRDNGWIIYGNAGGVGNLINEINSMLKLYESLPKDNHKYLRCFVLIDSDRKFPTEERNRKRKGIFEFLDNLGITYHELEKREIENYMPDEILETISQNSEFIKSYLKLSSFQKDFFDLEKGFEGNFESLDPMVKELFSNLNNINDDFKIFRSSKIELKGSFKAEFPKFFLDPKVSQENLKKRVAHQTNDPNELETILDKITKLL